MKTLKYGIFSMFQEFTQKVLTYGNVNSFGVILEQYWVERTEFLYYFSTKNVGEYLRKRTLRISCSHEHNF